MSRFVDELIPDTVPGYPCISSPRWSTDIQIVDSGAERANQRWEHPLRDFTLPDAVREQETFEIIYHHWLAMRGPLYTFPFSDPLDFASASLESPNIEPTLSVVDQPIGTGDGFTTDFQLVKVYSSGGQTYTRNIYHPVSGTVIIGINGANADTLSPTIDYTVNRLTGIVSFDVAPVAGTAITAGYLFDVEVRFSDDSTFDGIVKTYGVSGFASIELTEVRPCAC